MTEGPIFNKILGEGWGDRFGNFTPREIKGVTVYNGFLGELQKQGGISEYVPREFSFSAAPKPQPLNEDQIRLLRMVNIVRKVPIVKVTEELTKGPVNDLVITTKTLGSGIEGYSKADITDLFGRRVGYDKRMSAGINTLSLPVMFANPEARVAEALVGEGALAGEATTSLVQANRTAGNTFRDELAAALRAEGRTVRTEVYKRTPFGKRYIDIDVKYNGVNFGRG